MSNTHRDAIVVGSGLGGSVTAYRLVEASLAFGPIVERSGPDK